MARSWFLKLFKGREFEEVAISYMIKNKYKLVCRNYSCRFGEIDAVFLKKECIVAVEIKGGKDFPPPYFRVNKDKLLKITKTLELFLVENPGVEYSSVRVDVISVTLPKMDISHFKNVLSEL